MCPIKEKGAHVICRNGRSTSAGRSPERVLRLCRPGGGKQRPARPSRACLWRADSGASTRIQGFTSHRWDEFHISVTDFHDWLHVWRMDTDPENIRTDINNFTQRTMEREAFDVLKSEIDNLGSVKASFGLEVYFSLERQNEEGQMEEEKQRLFQRRYTCIQKNQPCTRFRAKI